MKTECAKNYPWWKNAVIYEVYIRSFFDFNNDGIGDIPGFIEKLDYLKNLGVDALWGSPLYPSPMKDFGYDITDHYAIQPDYDNLEDFDELIHQAHKRDIKIILDLVLNHTSDQHSQFRESRFSKNSPKRDWYIWQPDKNDEPPNNWRSQFDGSAWTKDEPTGEYYYHAFLKSQPDLNYRK